ncbi:MAG: DUF4198 domain-containing protein [Nannocystaceae bacterium]|nr:DUF4198 domain-containing protein [Nannocystaceae bacterium]
MTRARRWLLGAALLLGAWVSSPTVSAGPAIDPRAMSGIPRADPQLAAGSITVRVLDGGFDAPAVDVEVTLALTGADGSTASRTAKTDAQGRASFEGLSGFIGGSAIAKATRGGVELTSQPMELYAEAGTRVMLVAAGSGAAAAPRHGEPGGPEVPMPGNAFPLEGTPAGELVVGTFDLDARKPLPGVEVTLELTLPDGTTQTRKATSDERGKSAFPGLLPPALAEGTKLAVSATLVPGAAAQRSAPFQMDPKIGMAVVLAKGEFKPQASAPAQQQGPAPLPGPRFVPGLPQGTVRVRIVDGADQPVAGQRVVVVKKDQTGNDVRYTGDTGPKGTVDVEVDVQSDAFYLVEARYDGGPYQSDFFQVDRKGGVAVDLRVWDTTSDVSQVRSVVQFDVDGLENDLARVVQLQDVMVMGNEAFWPEGGMRIVPAAGAKQLTVLPVSRDLLSHDEKAPFAQLAGPIPPGQLARLAVAYIVDHDGVADIEFSTPLDSLETSVLVGSAQTLTAAGAQRSEHASPIPDKTVWTMGPRKPGATLSFSVGGLPVRNPIYRRIGLWGGVALALAGVVAMLGRRRIDTAARLRSRRQELMQLLEQLPPGETERRQRLIASLDRVWRQLEALSRTQGGDGR